MHLSCNWESAVELFVWLNSSSWWRRLPIITHTHTQNENTRRNWIRALYHHSSDVIAEVQALNSKATNMDYIMKSWHKKRILERRKIWFISMWFFFIFLIFKHSLRSALLFSPLFCIAIYWQSSKGTNQTKWRLSFTIPLWMRMSYQANKSLFPFYLWKTSNIPTTINLFWTVFSFALSPDSFK